MATSGSTDFTLTAQGIVEEAAEILGVKGLGSALSAEDSVTMRRSLNLMLKTWGTDPHLWLKTEGTITPLASTASYALATKALKVFSIRRRLSDIDVPLSPLSRQEYFDLPNKASTGTPVSFYYDPQLSTGTVYLWPCPDTTFAASGSLRYTYARKIEDIDAQTNDLDLPQEWLEAVAYNLAARLLHKFPAENAQMIRETAAGLLQNIREFDQEDTSVFFAPHG